MRYQVRRQLGPANDQTSKPRKTAGFGASNQRQWFKTESAKTNPNIGVHREPCRHALDMGNHVGLLCRGRAQLTVTDERSLHFPTSAISTVGVDMVLKPAILLRLAE